MWLRDGYGMDDVLGYCWLCCCCRCCCSGRRTAVWTTRIGDRHGEDGRGGDCDTEIFFLMATAAATGGGIGVATIVTGGGGAGRGGDGSVVMVTMARHG